MKANSTSDAAPPLALTTSGADRGWRPGSLRAELLFNLGFLAFAALLLALWTYSILGYPQLAGGRRVALAVLLLVLDVAVFLVLGRYLINRLVVRPLAGVADVAEAITRGEYQRRAAPGETREISAVAHALNALTDQLLEDREKLSHNVRSLGEVNRLLVDTQRDLIQAEKLASIGRLAAGVAHEVGNPLSSLLGYHAILRRRGVEPELVGGMEREARRIDRIVRGLLEYARPSAADGATADVNASLLRVLELLCSQGRLRRVEVRLRLQPDLPPVNAAPHPLDQLWINLFTNADDAMAGEGELTVRAFRDSFAGERERAARRSDDPPEIDYSHLRRFRESGQLPAKLSPGDEVVRVEVEDDGPGLAPEAEQLIWDPFYTTKPPGEGTGLGLAIVASTVAELGGDVRSEPVERGARFVVSLPVASDRP